ncbi:MocE family 2Fe-2S type ferredoxin [Kordiimonas sp.]|uniref:MocE family 2Fe-2S type ferredoxin n=1 Tax=Kordiimonas sp. TaxID=1970157 RepID=UPI003A8EF661
MPWINACSTDDIDAEDVIRFDHAGRTFAIYRNHENAYYCTDGLCTHEEVHLSEGLVVENTIECPKHASIFNFTDGEVETPPACENLTTYRTKVEDGRVFVCLLKSEQ